MKIDQLLETTLAEISKKFGQESIMLLGQKKLLQKPPVFSSGSLMIDDILGIGGYPVGRVIEIYGPESSGKTTLTLHAIAEVQKQGGIAAFIDAEHAIDPIYAQKLGVNINNLILSQPDSGEQALEIVDTLAKAGVVDLIVIDSVAALTPEVELQGAMRDQTIGAQARLMSKALRKITASLNKNKTTIIFINQIRSKIGVMFGNPEVTPGGRALKFYASIRLDVRRISSIGSGQSIMGNNIRVKVVKNKLAPPFRMGETEIIFAHGISKIGEMINYAQKLNIIERKGSWYIYQQANLAQGKENLKKVLHSNETLYKQVQEQILTKINQEQEEN